MRRLRVNHSEFAGEGSAIKRSENKEIFSSLKNKYIGKTQCRVEKYSDKSRPSGGKDPRIVLNQLAAIGWYPKYRSSPPIRIFKGSGGHRRERAITQENKSKASGLRYSPTPQ